MQFNFRKCMTSLQKKSGVQLLCGIGVRHSPRAVDFLSVWGLISPNVTVTITQHLLCIQLECCPRDRCCGEMHGLPMSIVLLACLLLVSLSYLKKERDQQQKPKQTRLNFLVIKGSSLCSCRSCELGF